MISFISQARTQHNLSVSLLLYLNYIHDPQNMVILWVTENSEIDVFAHLQQQDLISHLFTTETGSCFHVYVLLLINLEYSRSEKYYHNTSFITVYSLKAHQFFSSYGIRNLYRLLRNCTRLSRIFSTRTRCFPSGMTLAPLKALTLMSI